MDIDCCQSVVNLRSLSELRCLTKKRCIIFQNNTNRKLREPLTPVTQSPSFDCVGSGYEHEDNQRVYQGFARAPTLTDVQFRAVGGTRHFFLLTPYHFKNIGGHVPPCPPTPRII